MAKINLDLLDEDKQLAILSKYHRNVYKNGINSDCFDPYISTRRIKKRFIISPEKCEYLLQKLIERNNRLSQWIELGFI